MTVSTRTRTRSTRPVDLLLHPEPATESLIPMPVVVCDSVR